MRLNFYNSGNIIIRKIICRFSLKNQKFNIAGYSNSLLLKNYNRHARVKL